MGSVGFSGLGFSMERNADVEMTAADVFSARACAAWGVELGVCFERKRLRAECPGHVARVFYPPPLTANLVRSMKERGLIGGFFAATPWLD
jgi:hypothetical protein